MYSWQCVNTVSNAQMFYAFEWIEIWITWNNTLLHSIEHCIIQVTTCLEQRSTVFRHFNITHIKLKQNRKYRTNWKRKVYDFCEVKWKKQRQKPHPLLFNQTCVLSTLLCIFYQFVVDLTLHSQCLKMVIHAIERDCVAVHLFLIRTVWIKWVEEKKIILHFIASIIVAMCLLFVNNCNMCTWDLNAQCSCFCFFFL